MPNFLDMVKPKVFGEQNNDDDPANTPDYLNNDFGGPGAIDQWNDSKWVDGTAEQPIQKLYKAFRLSLPVPFANPAVLQNVSLDVPDTPDWWIIGISSQPTQLNPSYASIQIGQVSQTDEVIMTMGGHHTNGPSADFRRVILRGKSNHLFISAIITGVTIISSGGTQLDISVWAVTGYNPNEVGIFT